MEERVAGAADSHPDGMPPRSGEGVARGPYDWRHPVPPSAARVLTALALAALVFLGLWGAAVPPDPRPLSAPADAFSATRAMRDVRELARVPRPTGSAANERARGYLVARLRSLGLEPVLQATTAVSARYGVAGDVTNILARLPGTRAGGKALLLMAHYDGVPAGPAAGDDASGVAVVLETIRALRAGPPLRDDVIVLLTDGEEAGLLGAEAFVHHPWASEVGAAVNVEARGTGGRSLMFETGDGNAAIVRAFAAAAPHPTASSFMYAIYKRLPNDTDFSVMRRAGLQGLNFAFIARPDEYHTPHDDVDRLDPGSLQDHGDAVLAVARRLGNQPLPLPRAGDVAFFSVPGLGLAVYPVGWTLPLTILATLLFAAAIALGVARRRLGRRELAFGLLGALTGVVLATALAFGAWLLLLRFHASLPSGGRPQMSAVYLAGLAALAGAVFLAVARLFRRWSSPAALLAGGLAPWLILAWACALWLPAGAYLFLVPALAGAGALLLHAIAGESRGIGLGAAAMDWVTAAAAILLVAPMIWLVFLGLGLQPPGAFVVALLVALTLALLPFQLELVQATRPWLIAGVLLVAAAALLAWGAATVRYGPESPRPSVADYALDVNAGRASWLVGGARRLEQWERRVLGGQAEPARPTGALRADGMLVFMARAGRLFAAPAAIAPLPPPTATIVADSAAPPGRVVRLRIASARGAPALMVRVPGGRVRDASVAGLPVGGSGRRPWRLTYVDPPAGGFELRLGLAGADPATLEVMDQSNGLPAIGDDAVPPRPASLLPFQNGDRTIVARAYRF